MAVNTEDQEAEVSALGEGQVVEERAEAVATAQGTVVIAAALAKEVWAAVARAQVG
jgi:hypothetical protein